MILIFYQETPHQNHHKKTLKSSKFQTLKKHNKKTPPIFISLLKESIEINYSSSNIFKRAGYIPTTLPKVSNS